MAINVVCPGCLKRFKVSDRFAGMKGPCPNCNTIIDIPKAAVKIHGGEDFDQGGRTITGKLILKPIDRLDMDFSPTQAALICAGVLTVLLVAMMLGSMKLDIVVRDWIGCIGLFLIAFPLSLFGYQLLRDPEELFMLTGVDLLRKTAVAGAVYAVLWMLFETVAWYLNADLVFIWIYFAVFACMAMLATHAMLDINLGNAMLHFLIFAFVVIVLRWAIGLGWLWLVAETVRHGGVPPAPILPGM